MNASFNSSDPCPTIECGICLEPLDTDVMTHNGQGLKHPLHKNCIKDWLKNNRDCPFCRVDIDSTSLFSIWERTVNYLNMIDSGPNTSEGLSVILGIWVRHMVSS